jgi:hypothetical protein
MHVAEERDLEARRAQAASAHAVVKPGAANLAQQTLQRAAMKLQNTQRVASLQQQHARGGCVLMQH